MMDSEATPEPMPVSEAKKADLESPVKEDKEKETPEASSESPESPKEENGNGNGNGNGHSSPEKNGAAEKVKEADSEPEPTSEPEKKDDEDKEAPVVTEETPKKEDTKEDTQEEKASEDDKEEEKKEDTEETKSSPTKEDPKEEVKEEEDKEEKTEEETKEETKEKKDEETTSEEKKEEKKEETSSEDKPDSEHVDSDKKDDEEVKKESTPSDPFSALFEDKKEEKKEEKKEPSDPFSALMEGGEVPKKPSPPAEEKKEGDEESKKMDFSDDDTPMGDVDIPMPMNDEEEKKDSDEKKEEGGASPVEDIVFLAEKKKKEVPEDAVYFETVDKEELGLYEEVLPRKASSSTSSMQCTACWKQITGNGAYIQRHPVLGVAMCSTCFHFYHCGEWTRDEDGLDQFCRWCANGGDILICDKCPNAFCKRCITRNLGRKTYTEVSTAEEWKCLVCEPKPLMPLRAHYHALFKQGRTGRKTPEPSSAKKAKTSTNSGDDEEIVNVSAAPRAMATSSASNIIDQNLNVAFQALAHLQKGLMDERRRWGRVAEKDDDNAAANATKNMRRLFGVTRHNMDLLDAKLVKNFVTEHYDEDLIKIGRVNNSSSGVPDKLKSITLPKGASTSSSAATPSKKKAAPARRKVVIKKKKKASPKKKSKVAGKARVNGRTVTARYADMSSEEEEEEEEDEPEVEDDDESVEEDAFEDPPKRRKPAPKSVKISLLSRPMPKSAKKAAATKRKRSAPGPKSKRRRVDVIDIDSD